MSEVNYAVVVGIGVYLANEIYRETLGFHSAKERYNELSLIICAL